MRSMFSRGIALAFALGALGACGAGIGSDAEGGELEADLGSLEQALGASCGNMGPVQRAFTARASAFTASAAMQSQGCQGDAYMFSIQSYNNGLNPLQNPQISPLGAPATAIDCEGTELSFYVWAGGTLRGSASENGHWQGGALGCALTVVAPATLATGGTYKFAVRGKRGGALIPVRVEHPYQ